MLRGASLVLGSKFTGEVLEWLPMRFPFDGEGSIADLCYRSQGDAVQGWVAATDDDPFSDVRVEFPSLWQSDDDGRFATVLPDGGVHGCCALGRSEQRAVGGVPAREVRRPRSVGGEVVHGEQPVVFMHVLVHVACVPHPRSRLVLASWFHQCELGIHSVPGLFLVGARSVGNFR